MKIHNILRPDRKKKIATSLIYFMIFFTLFRFIYKKDVLRMSYAFWSLKL